MGIKHNFSRNLIPRIKGLGARIHAAADLPSGFARQPEPLRGVRQMRNNSLLKPPHWGDCSREARPQGMVRFTEDEANTLWQTLSDWNEILKDYPPDLLEDISAPDRTAEAVLEPRE